MSNDSKIPIKELRKSIQSKLSTESVQLEGRISMCYRGVETYIITKSHREWGSNILIIDESKPTDLGLLLERHKKMRNDLSVRQSMDYYQLEGLENQPNYEKQAKDIIAKLKKKHHEEKTKLYKLINEQCKEYNLEQFDYIVDINEPKLEKISKRAGYALFLALGLAYFLLPNIHGAYMYLLLFLGLFCIFIPHSGRYARNISIMIALVIYTFMGTSESSYYIILKYILVIFIIAMGFWIRKISLKNQYGN